MLNQRYLCKGEDSLTLVEPADDEHPEQRVAIKCSIDDIGPMYLYRFDTTDNGNSDHLPFFDKSDHAPHGLNKFCDYILLVQHKTKGLFVFLLEMKRGERSQADMQLDRSSDFFDYIRQSAKRIQDDNYWEGVDFMDNIKYRKIVIVEERSNKRQTKPKDVEAANLEGYLYHKCHDEFRPAPYCVK